MAQNNSPVEPEAFAEILGNLTPAKLLIAINDLAAQEPPGEVGLRLDAVIASLVQGVSLGEGAEGWRNTIKLKQTIAALASEMPGIRYIEGDA